MTIANNDFSDTWMQPWGDRYVEGYDHDGRQRIDLIFQNLSMVEG